MNDTETAITAAIARLAPGALKDARETALFADGYRAGRNESPAPDAPPVITGRDAEIWAGAYRAARPRRPDDWPFLPPGATARMQLLNESAPGPDKRCYSNPISARAAGGYWAPTPHKIRPCNECGIPLTYTYGMFIGLNRILCRPCRGRRPGLLAPTRRPCAGCGALLAETRLYDGACSPACARVIGVNADVLAPFGAVSVAKCRNYESCGALAVVAGPLTSESLCAACA